MSEHEHDPLDLEALDADSLLAALAAVEKVGTGTGTRARVHAWNKSGRGWVSDPAGVLVRDGRR